MNIISDGVFIRWQWRCYEEKFNCTISQINELIKKWRKKELWIKKHVTKTKTWNKNQLTTPFCPTVTCYNPCFIPFLIFNNTIASWCRAIICSLYGNNGIMLFMIVVTITLFMIVVMVLGAMPIIKFILIFKREYDNE